MTEIVVFHSALVLPPGVLAFADDLRYAGHTVHTPDYSGGHVFDDLTAGVAYRDELGTPEIANRAAKSTQDMPGSAVYCGFSLGTGGTQMLAQRKPGALGALLLHGCLPTAAFATPWPDGVPLAVHTMDRDPWVDLSVACSRTRTSPITTPRQRAKRCPES